MPNYFRSVLWMAVNVQAIGKAIPDRRGSGFGEPSQRHRAITPNNALELRLIIRILLMQIVRVALRYVASINSKSFHT